MCICWPRLLRRASKLRNLNLQTAKAPAVASEVSLHGHPSSLTTARTKQPIQKGGYITQRDTMLAAVRKSLPATGAIKEPQPKTSPTASPTADYVPKAVLLTGGAGFIGSHGK